jgi:two-component system osmolarity sensor histidine kinase EnvZ
MANDTDTATQITDSVKDAPDMTQDRFASFTWDKEDVGASESRTQRAKSKSWLKRFLPRSLLGRSLLILVTPIMLIQIISTIVFLDNHWDRILNRLAFAVAGEIAIIVKAIEDGANDESIERMTGYVAQNLHILMSYEKGKLIEDKDFSGQPVIWKSIALKSLSRELESQLRRPFFIHADFEEKWVEVNIQLDGGVLNVLFPERRFYSSSGHIFLIWMFGSSIVLCLVAVLFMRNQIRPIRRLAVAAEWFGRGRDVQKFKVEGAAEVRQAGQAFLDMRRRIKRQVTQRTIMLAGVSHDLRTPLTRMKLTLEMMPDSEDVRAMKDDIAQMNVMIDGYLNFVRGQEEEPLAVMPLTVLTDKILAQLTRLDGQGGEGATAAMAAAALHWTIPDYITMPLRPHAMERAIRNLLDNAARYAKNVWISADIVDEDRVEIVIEDDGTGIPEDRYEDVFKPFFRLDPARGPSSGNVGLGMPIVMDIVHNHGGRIWLEKSAHGGLKVVMRLPL